MKIKQLLLFLLLISINFSRSQTKIFTGIILSDSGIGLDNASIMANPLQKQASLKFATANADGKFKLILDANISYQLSISYIGFLDENFDLNADSKITEHTFKLVKSNENLKEIIIKYDVKPIIIKPDTLIFDVKSFTNGTERKLKDQLKKLPGVEVDKDGSVKVQGKRVTTFLVENKTFFGGGTKLGVENIPADAVDKVEILDHFTDDGFMKKVSGSKQLAMNIHLKKDKKKFIFGDIEGASGVPDFYKLHTGIFKYQPSTNISFIGDVNTIGKSTLEIEDIMRFEGGSNYLTNKNSSYDLFAFFREATNVISNKTKFSALNFSHELNKKLEVSGYVLFSKTDKESKKESRIKYFQNNINTQETRNELENSTTQIGLAKLKLKYNPNDNEVIKYDVNLKINSNLNGNNLETISNFSNNFDTNQKTTNFSLKHFVEWNKSVNTNSKLTFVLNQNFEKIELNKNWLTNSVFLSGLLPLQPDLNYNVNQQGIVKNNTIDGLFKWYYILNNFNHLYFIGGNSYSTTLFYRNEKQVLSNGNSTDFFLNGFGNNLNYNFNDAFAGVEYKSIFKKWTNKLGLFAHNYQLKTDNYGFENIISRTYLEPEITSDYEFSKAHTLSFYYKFNNQFPKTNNLANRNVLLNYNAIYQGNQLLENEQFHDFNFYYKKNDLFRGLMLNASTSWTKKTTSIRDAIQINGINQITTSIFSKNPESNLTINGSINKNIYKFNLDINTRFSLFEYFQTINSSTNSVSRKSHNIGAILKFTDLKWPFLTFKYNKTFNTFSSATVSKFETDTFAIDYDYEISEEFNFVADYDFQKNKNSQGQVTSFQSANANLEFKPKRSPWSFQVSITNAFNTGTINSNSFSDYLVSEQTTFILPRIVMLHLSYKL